MPTGNLDSKTSQDVLGLLKVTGRKFAQTIVMITHNEEIAQLADRIIRIEDGRVLNIFGKQRDGIGQGVSGKQRDGMGQEVFGKQRDDMGQEVSDTQGESNEQKASLRQEEDAR